MHGIQRHVFVASGRDAAGGLRREAEQRLDRAAGALTGAEFEHLAQQHQHGDDRGGLEVERGFAAVPGAGGEDAAERASPRR